MPAHGSLGFRTEVEFTLPKGYLDEHGVLHRQGVMRLATAADEITATMVDLSKLADHTRGEVDRFKKVGA